MSKISPGPRRERRRRADAERSIAAILDAAVRVLNARPVASVDEIAAAAGVTRPTVYAHFPSRQALLNAAADRVTEDALAAMDDAELDHGPPAAALLRFMSAGWQTFERYPLLLAPSAMQADPQADHDRHEPVRARLEQLITRGQHTGDFDSTLSPTWLTAITIGLGHIAGEQVATGNMTTDEAWAALRESTLRVLGIDHPPSTTDPRRTE